jgi:hypothetical protein
MASHRCLGRIGSVCGHGIRSGVALASVETQHSRTRLSADRLMTRLEITTSMEASGTGSLAERRVGGPDGMVTGRGGSAK